ncbi:hypothetical protein SEA_ROBINSPARKLES_22 [Gordonia phage RobinSparkles]|nr:hypothetical protein SEA_ROBINSPARKLES_22 [Gordonia phage RobinSparkles]
MNPNDAIDFTKPHFPGNIVNLVAASMEFIAPDQGDPVNDPENFIEGARVFKRPLQITDGSISIGVSPRMWTPDESSLEMGFGRSPVEPTRQSYTIEIQALVISADEEEGIATHSVLSSMIRHMLYRDQALALALPQLEVTHAGFGSPVRETLKKWNISRQVFMNTEYNNQFAFLSTVDFHAETTLQ